MTKKLGRPITNRDNYALQGYSEADGLGVGQWVPVPNSAGILKWVGEKESDIEEPPRGKGRRRTKACQDCGETVSRQALRCRPCSLERVRLTNRRYMAYQRGKQDAA